MTRVNPNVVIVAIVMLIAMVIAAVTGLTFANRPVANVLELCAAVTVPTIASFFTLIGIKNVSTELKNGTGDLIAQKTAEAVKANVTERDKVNNA